MQKVGTADGSGKLNSQVNMEVVREDPPYYVVVAFRYGGQENVFPIGAFATQDDAERAAREHRNFRGGKYQHRIYQFDTIGKWDDDVGHATNSRPCIEAND